VFSFLLKPAGAGEEGLFIDRTDVRGTGSTPAANRRFLDVPVIGQASKPSTRLCNEVPLK